MFNINDVFSEPSMDSESIPVHPNSNSVRLFEILQGKYSYVTGQSIYATLRNSGVFYRQLFINLFKDTLSSCTYDDVLHDWKLYENSIRQRWVKKQDENNTVFRESTFSSWANTLMMTITELLTNNIYKIIYGQLTLSYERYVDWICATGIVPIAKIPLSNDAKIEITKIYNECLKHTNYDKNKILANVAKRLMNVIRAVIETIDTTFIPPFTDVIIKYNFKTNTFDGVYGKNVKLHKVFVMFPPFILKSSVVFDSPIQRLNQSILSCHRTTEHAKLCQLLNTSPVKTILGFKQNITYRDIMEYLESENSKKDPKRELMQLIIKLSENKTVSGVSDIVDEFVSDVSNNIVDRNKLFGHNANETTTQNLKKNVSDSIVKCLTKQINDQFDTIHGLEKERQMYLKKIHGIESRLESLSKSQLSNKNDKLDESTYPDILTSDTLTMLKGLNAQPSTSGMSTHNIQNDETVFNSFFSQYVPPFREMKKDLTTLWENELFNTFKLIPIVDNQGQRLTVGYSADTIAMLLAPFTYTVSNLPPIDIITDTQASMSYNTLIECLYNSSRLAIYIKDIGSKYMMQQLFDNTNEDEQQNKQDRPANIAKN